MKKSNQQVRNSLTYLMATAVASAMPLIALPFLTRALSKEAFGAWALTMVYASVASGLANLGLIIAYERNFFQCEDKRASGRLLYSVSGLVLANLALVAALTYVFRVRISEWVVRSPQYGDLVFWTFLATGAVSLKAYFLTYYRNTEDAGTYARYSVSSTVISTLTSLTLVCVMRVGPVGLAFGQFTGNSCMLVLLAVKASRELMPGWSWGHVGNSLAISLPLTPRLLLKVVGSQFDKYMIGLLATIGGAGIYSIGQQIGNLVFVFMTSLENVFAPQVYRRMFDMGEEGGREIGRYLTPFAYVSFGVALLVALFAEEVLFVLTPVSYHGASDIVSILAVFYGIMFFGKQRQMIYAKKTHIIALLSTGYVALVIALNVPFILRWGGVGAAWAMLAAGGIYTAVTFAFAQHYYRIGWEYRKVSGMVALLVAGATATVGIRAFGMSYLGRLPVKLALVAIHAWIGVRTGVLGRDNLLLVRDVIAERIAGRRVSS
ncbi:lipopolysaccharide biosynthesis protein [Verrucomicrobiota bacterium]